MKPCKLTAKLKRKTRKFEHLMYVCKCVRVCVYLSNTSLVHFIIVNKKNSLSGKLLSVLHFIYSWIENLQTLLRFRPNMNFSFSFSLAYRGGLYAPIEISKRKKTPLLPHIGWNIFFSPKQLKSNDYDCDFNGMKTKTKKWIFMFHLWKLICAVWHDFRLKCWKQTSSSFDLFSLFWYVCVWVCGVISGAPTLLWVCWYIRPCHKIYKYTHLRFPFITISFFMCLS